MKYLRLKNGHGSFVDLETGLRICGNERVEDDGRRGSLTQQWMSGGGIVVDETVEGTPNVVDVTPDDIEESAKSVEPQKGAVDDAEIKKMTWLELKGACKKAGVKGGFSDKRPDLERKLIKAMSRR